MVPCMNYGRDFPIAQEPAFSIASIPKSSLKGWVEKCGNTTYPENGLMSVDVWFCELGGQSAEVVSQLLVWKLKQ